ELARGEGESQQSFNGIMLFLSLRTPPLRLWADGKKTCRTSLGGRDALASVGVVRRGRSAFWLRHRKRRGGFRVAGADSRHSESRTGTYRRSSRGRIRRALRLWI